MICHMMYYVMHNTTHVNVTVFDEMFSHKKLIATEWQYSINCMFYRRLLHHVHVLLVARSQLILTFSVSVGEEDG